MFCLWNKFVNIISRSRKLYIKWKLSICNTRLFPSLQQIYDFLHSEYFFGSTQEIGHQFDNKKDPAPNVQKMALW